MAFRLAEKNTHFALPVIHPVTKQEVSAETLYNDCCAALGYTVRDNIGDLILDNLKYDAGAYDDDALCSSVYAWAGDVRRQLSAANAA